jgi:hypothetical protein
VGPSAILDAVVKRQILPSPRRVPSGIRIRDPDVRAAAGIGSTPSHRPVLFNAV